MSNRLEKIKKDYETGGLPTDVEWLIDQAERVAVLKKREEVRKLGAEANFVHYWNIEKQNKRYREFLEYLLEETIDHKEKGLRIQHWALIKDLEEALEESE